VSAMRLAGLRPSTLSGFTKHFGQVNSIRNGATSAFGTFPFGMLGFLIPCLA
jgi:hypothetical protein